MSNQNIGKNIFCKLLLSGAVCFTAARASASLAEEQVANFKEVCEYSSKLKSHDGLELIRGLCKVSVEEISYSLIQKMFHEASDFYGRNQGTFSEADEASAKLMFIQLGILGLTRFQLDH